MSRDLLSEDSFFNPIEKTRNSSNSSQGEMFVGASDGLLYRLYFGRAFTGSNEDLEIGLSSDSTEEEGDEALPMRSCCDSAEDKEEGRKRRLENLEDTCLFALTSMRRF